MMKIEVTCSFSETAELKQCALGNDIKPLFFDLRSFVADEKRRLQNTKTTCLRK